MMSSQDALVAIMVQQRSDDRVSKRELISIIRIVEHLPIFLDMIKVELKL